MKKESSTQEKTGFKIGDKVRFTKEFLRSHGFERQEDYPIFRDNSFGMGYLTVLDISNDTNPWVWFGQFYGTSGGRLKENFYNPRVFELYKPLEIKQNIKQLKF